MVCYGIFWSGQFERRDEEINAEKIIAAKYATLYAVANRKPRKKIQACRDWNPGLCDTGAANKPIELANQPVAGH